MPISDENTSSRQGDKLRLACHRTFVEVNEAVRAVGTATGANPLSWIIPAIASSGKTVPHRLRRRPGAQEDAARFRGRKVRAPCLKLRGIDLLSGAVIPNEAEPNPLVLPKNFPEAQLRNRLERLFFTPAEYRFLDFARNDEKRNVPIRCPVRWLSAWLRVPPSGRNRS